MKHPTVFFSLLLQFVRVDVRNGHGQENAPDAPTVNAQLSTEERGPCKLWVVADRLRSSVKFMGIGSRFNRLHWVSAAGYHG
jgi:hypothetical protein